MSNWLDKYNPTTYVKSKSQEIIDQANDQVLKHLTQSFKELAPSLCMVILTMKDNLLPRHHILYLLCRSQGGYEYEIA